MRMTTAAFIGMGAVVLFVGDHIRYLGNLPSDEPASAAAGRGQDRP
jgi:hypothetical protein